MKFFFSYDLLIIFTFILLWYCMKVCKVFKGIFNSTSIIYDNLFYLFTFHSITSVMREYYAVIGLIKLEWKILGKKRQHSIDNCIFHRVEISGWGDCFFYLSDLTWYSFGILFSKVILFLLRFTVWHFRTMFFSVSNKFK